MGAPLRGKKKKSRPDPDLGSARVDPKISLTPLWRILKDGSKQYGPKPSQARLHHWQKSVTQAEWKRINELSPACRACNGNNSQGHIKDKFCNKARSYIRLLKNREKIRKKQENVAKQQNSWKKTELSFSASVGASVPKASSPNQSTAV